MVLHAHVVVHVIFLANVVLQDLEGLVVTARDARHLLDLLHHALHVRVALAAMPAPRIGARATL